MWSAAEYVSKRMQRAAVALWCLALAQLVLASCEPDEFVLAGATRTALPQPSTPERS
jgi:hypothetical protein